MWRHIDVQADWRSWTYGRFPNAIDIISLGSLTCPSKHRHGTTLLTVIPRNHPMSVAFTTHMGIRSTYSRLKPQGPHGGIANDTFFRWRLISWAKKKRSDSVLWQKPLHRKKNQTSKVTIKTPPKSSITQRLQTELGRPDIVTTATQLVWLNWFMGTKPSHLPQTLWHI